MDSQRYRNEYRTLPSTTIHSIQQIHLHRHRRSPKTISTTMVW